MKESLTKQFDLKKYGFFPYAVLGFFIGSLLYSRIAFAFNVSALTHYLLPALVLSILKTTLFIGLLYIIKADWLFVPLWGIGSLSVFIISDYWFKSISNLNADVLRWLTLKRAMLSGFVEGIALALILILLVRWLGIRLYSLVGSFILWHFVTDIAALGIYPSSIYIFNEISLLEILSAGIWGALFFLGISFHKKKGIIV